jgi:hypothetical protein
MYNYGDWVLDSYEEVVFCYWLEELKELGLIKDFERYTKSIEIIASKQYQIKEKGVKTVKLVDKHLMHNLEYTPDFRIIWSEKADNILIRIKNKTYNKGKTNAIFIVDSNLESIVDVKGTFVSTRVQSSITFPIIQKILYDKFNIYCQAIIPLGPKGLFSKTFTPTFFLKTPTGKDRKINWKVKTCEQFLKQS